MKYIKHTFLSFCCLLTVNIMAAQFSIYGLTGVSGLKYQPEGGTQSAGIGFGGGVGYSIKLGKSWKAGTAAELATYSSKVSYDVISEKYEHGTDEHKSLFSYSLNGYEEKQSVAVFSVPLTLQYQTGNSIKFCLSGGIKFGLPISAKANIHPGTVSASGNYEYEGQTYVNLPQHGFPEGTELPEKKSDIDLGYSTAVTFETGLLVKKFYAGVYVDYGLNNMQKTKDKHPLEYHDSGSSMLAYNSILHSNLVDKINLFSAGLKVKIQF
jgi:hypothetical protein